MVTQAEQIADHLRSLRAFRDLPANELSALAAHAQVKRYSADEVVYLQGTPANDLYVVIGGHVCESVWDESGREVLHKQYGPGDCPGVDAFLQGRLQRGTARAATSATILHLPDAVVSRLVAQHPRFGERLQPPNVAGELRAMPILHNLSDEDVQELANLVHRYEARPQQVVQRNGDPETPLVLIRTGQVELQRGSHTQVLTAGNFFGEEAVLQGRPAQASARTLTTAELYFLPAPDFRRLLDQHPELSGSLDHPDIEGRLRQSPLFANLTAQQRACLAGYVRWIHYPAGVPVTIQGRLGADLHILHRGEAIVRQLDGFGHERPRDRRVTGDSFGETSLLLGDLRDATVETITDSDWLVLHREDFRLAQSACPGITGRLTLRPETQERLRQPVFSWLQEGELVVSQIRRHVIVVILKLLPSVLVAAALLALLLAVPGLPDWLVGTGLVVDALYALWSYVNWRNDYLVITSQRLTCQEKIWPIAEGRREAPLRQVQDINITRGLLGNALNFGQLRIQTAATVGLIEFSTTPDPIHVKELILDRVGRARVSAQAGQRANVRQALGRRLELGLELAPPLRAVPDPASPPASAVRRARGRGFRPWPWLRQEHEGTITWRKHWIRLLARASVPSLLCALLIAAAVFVGQGKIAFIPSGPPFWVPWILVTFGAGFWLWWHYADWKNDIYVLTADRIIDIEKKPLFFAEDRREAALGRVQNVNANIPSPLAYLLNYGHVEIYTAAETGRFDFLFVPNPREVQAEIFRRIERFRSADAQRQAQQRQTEIADWLETYHRLTTRRGK
jgi:CRP-like cAMP-binding protein/membrane protein YdbS with pleckstrin-like domain